MGKKAVVITGASGAMGSEAVKAMAADGLHVIMACRNLEKGEEKKNLILGQQPDASLELRKLELESLASVVEFSEGIARDGIEVTHLFNNAGTMCRYLELTGDDYEKTMQVNYLGPVLLILGLAEQFSPDVHIVNMVSLSCISGDIEKDYLSHGYSRKFSQLGTYSNSKLALLLFSLEHAARIPAGWHLNMADPGIVNTDMIRLHRWFDPIADAVFRPFCYKPATGVRPAVRAMHSEESGLYFSAKANHQAAERYLENPNREWLYNDTLALLKTYVS